MKANSPLIVLIIHFLSIWSAGSNYAIPQNNFVSFASASPDNSNQELSDFYEEAQDLSEGWSTWSDWSPCSRSCDGGVSHQLRTCAVGKCRGNHIRYRICNMQTCPESHEFREDQCAAYNTIPFNDTLYDWIPHYIDENLCALTCKGKPSDQEEFDDDFVMIVKTLAEKVRDGTRCRPGSLDMCIDGKCQRVGCDLQINSRKHVDACGICGGDGSSCFRPLYHWTLTYTSLCSVTCGGGYKMSRPVCQNRMTGNEVEEKLCNESQRPDATIIACNTHNCPPKWHASDWGICSVSCGNGVKIRQVQCVEENNNTKIQVDDAKCTGFKPWFQEECNQEDCPYWVTSRWSGCSVSCGEGVQVRTVECRDQNNELSALCSIQTKPETTKECSTGLPCEFTVVTYDEFNPAPQSLVESFPPLPNPEGLTGEQIVPSESTFIPDDWGPCSVSCGEGVRKRDVHCKIFLEFSRTIAKLPDKQCTGPKPIEIEPCYMEPCVSEKMAADVKYDPYSRADIKVAPGVPGKSYSWKEQGYTHCSATCLGGVQELIVSCVRDDTQKVTSPYMCPIELKPEIKVQTCNDHPCPPRWNYSEFSRCSQSCGIGIQTREVNCIHEVTQGGGNTVIVPNNMCPQPSPPDRQYCNVLDCPVRWKVEEWSRCSKSCGGGTKTRKVECKQTMAQNHTVDRSPAMCPVPKPAESKPCNTKSCVVESDKPHIDVSNSTFIQHDPKKKKISLKIGGAATVFLGTTIKIKCPVKRFDRTKIQWTKDKNLLPKSKKYKTSKKGALRVSNLILRDTGTYTCTASKSVANIHISVRPKPGEFPTSEEIQKHSFKTEKVNLISDVNSNRDEGTPNFSDDHSHEQRPGRGKKKTSKLFTPTLPSLRLDSNYNEQLQNTMDKSGETDRYSYLPQSTSEFFNPSEHGDSSSSASRIMPNIQKLIFNLQVFSHSRGHRMIDFPGYFPHRDNVPFFATATTDQLEKSMMEENNEEDSIVVLGKGTKENLEFEWTSGSWSKCSETCGGTGVQRRKINCIVRLYNASQPVDGILCEDAGLPAPLSTRKCGVDVCPLWATYEWSSCKKSKCFKMHKALRRRIVICKIANFTMDPSKCEQSKKPVEKEECYNEKCVAKWKAGRWSKCIAACQSKGIKYRIIECVWNGTKVSAGEACTDKARPPNTKPCVGSRCTKTEPVCKDQSAFCPNIKMLNMCKILRYQLQCCHTCRY